MEGLSPRVRGNPDLIAERLARQRSIPARAGEPHVTLFIPPESEVYPRACGGTFAVPLYPLSSSGLSPRVRGNRVAYCAI